MEKYFKIEIQLAESARQFGTGHIQLVNKFYHGDGAIKIMEEKIYGYIALDYLEGVIEEDNVELSLYTEDSEYRMRIPIEDFQLPQNFLMIYENVTIELSVQENIKNIQKQKRICEMVNEARTYVGW